MANSNAARVMDAGAPTTSKTMRASLFQERLLKVMDQKNHPSYWHLMGPNATKDQLRKHYQQEWLVYVRDFPLFLARILAKNPPAEVRRDLAENIFEEETGKLTLGVPHPELFLRMMEGLGFCRKDFIKAKLSPVAAAYRAWLDKATIKSNWLVGAVVVAVFVEGSRRDRDEVEGRAESELPLEKKLRQHPLVIHQGLDPKILDLQRAHSKAESGHRAAAWRMVMGYSTTMAAQAESERVLKRSLKLWKAYRDEVSRTCRLPKIAAC